MSELDVGVGENGVSLPQLRVLLAEGSAFSVVRPAGAFPGLQVVDFTDAAFLGDVSFFKRSGLFCVETGKTRRLEEGLNVDGANRQIPAGERADQPEDPLFELLQNERFNFRPLQALGDRLGLLLRQNAVNWEVLQEFDAPSIREGLPQTFFELRERWKVARLLFGLWTRARSAAIRRIVAEDELSWVYDDWALFLDVSA